MEIFTTTNILFLITIATVLVNVYLSLKKPQESSETNDAVFNERMTSYEKTTEKAVQLALNHSHTVESKLDKHVNESQIKGETDARWQGRMETLMEQLVNK